MSRSARTTKKQKEFVINFLSENKMLLGGKINPVNLPKVQKLWEELTKAVNEIGPPKTIKQWKETISEMKTNVRRRARNVRYGMTGTGGGEGVKPLSDVEERLLSLLSHLTVEGDDLPEAGVGPELNIEEMPIYIEEEEMQEAHETSNNAVIATAVDISNKNPSTSNCIIGGTKDTNISGVQRGIKAKQQRVKRLNSRKTFNANALEGHDRTLRQLAKSNYKLAQSINCLAAALNKIAHKM